MFTSRDSSSRAERLRRWTVAALAATGVGATTVFVLDLVVFDAFVIEPFANAAAILTLALLAAVRRPWTPAVAGLVVALLAAGSLTSPWVSSRLLHPAGQWVFFVPTLVGIVCGVAAGAIGVAATAAALRERRASEART